MADSFQIPQRNPQYIPPVAPPTDLIHELYSRPKPGEIAAGQMSDAVKAIYDRYIEMQKLKAGAFGEGGPALYKMLGYGDASTSASAPVAQQPQAPVATSQPAQGGGAIPQDKYHAIAGQLGVTPDFEGYTKAIGNIAGQMQQSAQDYGPSRFGQANQQMLGGQLSALKTGMEAQKAPLEYEQARLGIQKTEGDIAMQPMQAAKTEQDYRLATDKPIAEEVSKQRQKTTATDTADLLFNQFSNSFMGKGGEDLTKPSAKIPFITGASAKLSNATGGRYGNKAGGDMLDQSKPLANALVGLLTASGRMNPSLANDFVEGIIPKPDQTTAQKQEKMKGIRQLIDTIRTGDENALNAVVGTLKGGQAGRTGTPTSGATGPHGPTVTQNGHTYTWNGSSYE